MHHILRQLVFGTCLALTCACSPSRGSRADATAPQVFRDRVVAVLAAEFPDKKFEVTDDPVVLRYGGAEFSLQNLRAEYLSDENPTEETLRGLVKEHFDIALASIDSTAQSPPSTWESAQQLLRPQLMPSEYLAKMPLVYLPFGEGLVQGFVIDQPGMYSYVLSKDVERWGVTLDQVNKVAFKNLDVISKGIHLEVSTGSNPFLAVGGHDAYDAVRLLSPQFRKLGANRLGSPFYAAIPNRDFLIMWPANASASFMEKARENVARDFRDQPYPLTDKIFEVTPTQIKPVGQP